jgi:hypothetical protein
MMNMDKRPKWIDAFLGFTLLMACIAICIHAVKELLFLYEYFRI